MVLCTSIVKWSLYSIVWQLPVYSAPCTKWSFNSSSMVHIVINWESHRIYKPPFFPTDREQTIDGSLVCTYLYHHLLHIITHFTSPVKNALHWTFCPCPPLPLPTSLPEGFQTPELLPRTLVIREPHQKMENWSEKQLEPCDIRQLGCFQNKGN